MRRHSLSNTLKKHSIGRKSRTYETLSCIVYGKSLNLRRSWLKTFLQSLFSRSSFTRHPWVRKGLFVRFSYIFFPSEKFVKKFLNLKGIICTPKWCNKKSRSPCSFNSKTPSYLTISIIVDRNNNIRHVLGMRALIRKELWVILLSRILRTVSSCMIDFRHIYNVANLTNV